MSDSEAFYDSDEGYVGPSDDEGDPWAEDDEPAPSSAAMALPPAAPSELAAFRSTWTNEMNHSQQRRQRVQAFEPSSAASKVLLNPDLAERILANPALSRADLRSLALVCSNLCDAAQRSLLRAVHVRTLSQAKRLQAALDQSPHLVQRVVHVDFSLAEVSSVMTELPAVKEKMAQKQEKEDAQEIEYYRSRNGQTLALKPWQQELRGDVGPAATGNELEETRRLKHLDWAVKAIEEEKPSQQWAVGCVMNELAAALRHWPFDPAATPDPALSPLLASLAGSATSLTFSFPLAHFLPALIPSLPSAPPLRTLSVRARADCQAAVQQFEDNSPRPPPADSNDTDRRPYYLKSGLTASPAHVELRSDGRGIKGPWSNVEDFVLRGAVLRLSSSNAGAGSDDKPWALKKLELRHVMVQPASRSSAVSRGLRPQSADVPFDVLFDLPHTPPRPSSHPHLELFLFAGLLSISSPSHTLTSLILSDVDNISLSSVHRAIEASGPTLTVLALENLNLGVSALNPSFNNYVNKDLRFTFRLAGSPPRQPAIEAEVFSKLAAAGRLLPSQPAKPAPSLAHVLQRCTSLRVLRLISDPDRLHTSPYPPQILDALLDTRPPLEELQWDVGLVAHGEGGWLNEDGWTDFADRLDELARRDGFSALGSTVQVAASTVAARRR
ncbi:hypothetical protein JCM10213_002010 [Rhodosporidiobolus nylandii]